MQMLKRNMQTIYYKTYVSKTPETDADGLYTGEYTITYSDVKTLRAYVAPRAGGAFDQMFGRELNYNRVIIAKATDIDENSLLWVETSDTSGDPDYIVSGVYKSLNFVNIAIRKA